MRLQSNKLTDRKTGVVLEYLVGDVPISPGQDTWTPRTGIGTINHTIENWINDNASPAYAGYTGVTGVFTSAVVIPKLLQGQSFMMWVCAEFAGAQNNFNVGDASIVGGIKIKKAISILTDAEGETLTTGALTAPTDTQLVACVYDPVGESFVMYQFDDAGAFVEQKSGVDSGSFDFTSGIDFHESVTLPIPVTEIVGFNICSMGLVYFDALPTDIMTGLTSMSADPEGGCYDAWRNL